MTAMILDGKQLAQTMQAELATEVARFTQATGVRRATLSQSCMWCANERSMLNSPLFSRHALKKRAPAQPRSRCADSKAARACALPASKTNPVRPSSTISGMPPARDTAAGTP